MIDCFRVSSKVRPQRRSERNYWKENKTRRGSVVERDARRADEQKLDTSKRVDPDLELYAGEFCCHWFSPLSTDGLEMWPTEKEKDGRR